MDCRLKANLQRISFLKRNMFYKLTLLQPKVFIMTNTSIGVRSLSDEEINLIGGADGGPIGAAVGAAVGAIIGGATGGPIGAAVGAVIGATLGSD